MKKQEHGTVEQALSPGSDVRRRGISMPVGLRPSCTARQAQTLWLADSVSIFHFEIISKIPFQVLL